MHTNSWISGLAKTGLTAKGVVYLILGTMAFMAAFEIGGQSNDDASQSGVLNSLKEMPAGSALLVLLTAGLVCYSLWRFIQAFHPDASSTGKKWAKAARYVISGLAYLSLAISSVQVLLHQEKNNGDQKQHWAEEIMHQPFGQWLLGIAALVLAGVGIYQVWYGLSGKYRKHVEERTTKSEVMKTLLTAGKIGYVARGVVWLLISYLLLKAALDANPGEAGDTGKAFQFLEDWSAGSLLLGALGLGLIAYGIFNFIRARLEHFK